MIRFSKYKKIYQINIFHSINETTLLYLNPNSYPPFGRYVGKEKKANIIVEEEKTPDIKFPDHALKSAPSRRTSRDPTSREDKDRNADNARVISQGDLRPKELPKTNWSSIASDLR